MTIKYLVVATEERGAADAAERGWVRLAYARFASPEKDDIRMVRRTADLIPYGGGKTQMIRGSDYEDGPAVHPDRPGDIELLERWLREKESFDKFVSEGHGEWVEA